ncbi:hypothetical protein PF005_g26313 [Phytophthora fragariae]|uniref:Uncharacterized protein n=1 Tax=Phytophthora fragariae TaxID=53985 RepID=A0A6A3TTA8_9STRA|nr:hypothetical protein PF003_g12058 [Phytophthora fragariae]KAE8938088.1 hypothetical protein PF009_g12024 [Phytophthora fragariae]KAE9003833.1 hypothetical protein PF011_g12740 [Phytophthora fragariae]KAE9076083.1 hypothetical protein PF010_g24047 [Phytophthora fragariae]KAE9105149.1 hypothetical protein PF007_g13796 [Phytophthora fragariae]
MPPTCRSLPLLVAASGGDTRAQDEPSHAADLPPLVLSLFCCYRCVLKNRSPCCRCSATDMSLLSLCCRCSLMLSLSRRRSLLPTAVP